MSETVCKGCGIAESNTMRAWTLLKNYYGLNGIFCSSCTNMIKHDCDGKPKDPALYTFLLLKCLSEK
jgi:hypothetical protein